MHGITADLRQWAETIVHEGVGKGSVRTAGSPARWLNALSRLAGVYATPCPVVQSIAPVPAVCAELFGDGLRWCIVGIRCRSFVLG